MTYTATPTTQTSTFTSALAAFRLRLKGRVLLPGDEGYDAAREIHNAIIDRRPAMIVKVKDAADVSRAVRFARAQGLDLAVRSGGHSFAGHSLVDDGLVIDMTEMNELRIDPAAKVAWSQPGVLAGDFAREAQEYGLAVPFGDAASVGVAGITLGGGIGFLVRKYGLTIDNLTAVELVTADGTIVHASDTENSDLFWALRGGGGNFGIVTGFEYRLVDVGMVYGGVLVLPATADVLRNYAKVAMDAPNELTTISMIMHAPPAPFVPVDRVGETAIAIFTVYSGDMARAEEVVAPMRALAEPIADVLGPIPYAGIYEFMAMAELRRREKVRSGFFPEFSDDMIDSILTTIEQAPGPEGIFQVRPLGGAMADVPPEMTAFSHRDARFLVTVIDIWDEASEDTENRRWVDYAWDAIKESREGVYSNFLEDEGEARIREAYAARTYARLAEVKGRYDPENFFSRNQNIRPQRVAAAA